MQQTEIEFSNIAQRGGRIPGRPDFDVLVAESCDHQQIPRRLLGQAEFMGEIVVAVVHPEYAPHVRGLDDHGAAGPQAPPHLLQEVCCPLLRQVLEQVHDEDQPERARRVALGQAQGIPLLDEVEPKRVADLHILGREVEASQVRIAPRSQEGQQRPFATSDVENGRRSVGRQPGAERAFKRAEDDASSALVLHCRAPCIGVVPSVESFDRVLKFHADHPLVRYGPRP